MPSSDTQTYTWARGWLIAAGVYNLVWGAVVIAFPGLLFEFAGMDQPRYPQIWQCVGMIVGVYGIGYLVASRSYRTHWPIVLVGFLGKVLGPLGFAGALIREEFPLRFGVTIITNDLVWWIPFALMLWDTFRAKSAPPDERVEFDAAVRDARDQHGASLQQISSERSALVVFTRHSGCVFCKEALADLARQHAQIESSGTAIVVVTMSETEKATATLERAGLESVHVISDPEQRLYRAFELARGRFMQLFGPRQWLRGALATLRGNFVGSLDGDGFQLGGAFLVRDGAIVRAARHRSASDRVDHASLACDIA